MKTILSLLGLKAWWIAAVLAASVFLAGTHWRAYTSGKKAVQAEWNVEKIDIARQSFKLAEQATRATTNLQADIDTQRQEKNHEIARLNTRHDAALERLRQRPERPAGDAHVPATASNGQVASGCTGAELYRQDGQLLVGEFVRAETIRLELKACYQQYDKARASIDALNEARPKE